MGDAILGGVVALVAVLAAAGLGKLRGRAAFREFADSLPATGLVPARWRRPAAAALVATELAAALLLLPPPTRPAGFALAAGLFAVLTAGAGWTVAAGRRVACRCFGGPGRPLGWPQVARNALLAAVAAGGLAAGLFAPGGGSPAGAALAVAAGGIVALLAVRLDDIVDLFAPPAARTPAGTAGTR